MTLLQLTYFIEVCNCKNMTKAAQNLHISQPAITKAIKELEREFGASLFVHQKSCQELTFEGKVLYEQGVKLVRQFSELENTMSQICSKNKVLKVGTSVIFNKLYPEFISDFQKAYPYVEVKNYIFGSVELKQYIKSGFLDVAISGLIKDERLQNRILVNTESHFWTNIKNPLASKKRIDIDEDLKEEKMGIFRESIFDFQDDKPSLENQVVESVPANISFYTNQLDKLEQQLVDGTVSTFLPKLIFQDRKELCSIPTDPPICFSVAAYWKDPNAFSYIMEFVNFAEQYVLQRR